MDTITRSCNVCGGTKKNPNERWFIAATRPGVPGIGFGYEDSAYAESDVAIEHLCGEMCMHVRLTRWAEQQEKKEAA